MKTPEERITVALDIADSFGQIDGDHHKAWVIDQMVRVLTGDGYAEFVKKHEGEIDTDGCPEYAWNEGIAP